MACVQRYRLDLLDGLAHHGSETSFAVALFSSSPFHLDPVRRNHDCILLPGLARTCLTDNIGIPLTVFSISLCIMNAVYVTVSAMFRRPLFL